MFSFVAGSCIGSFLCAAAFRYDQPKLKQHHRSICPHCHQYLMWYDLIPVFSWMNLKGHCRFCHHDIPLDHLLCELLCGCLFIWLVHQKDFMLLGISCVLIYAAYADLYHGLIPDRCHVFLMVLFFLSCPEDILKQLLLASCVLVLLTVVALTSKGMGLGDVKLIASMSLFMNIMQMIEMICIASTSALICTLPAYLFHKHEKKDKIRFAPYLSFACFVVMTLN